MLLSMKRISILILIYRYRPDLMQQGISHDHDIQDPIRLVLEMVLFEHRHAGLGRKGYLPRILLYLPGKELEEGGFSGAVRAYDAVAISGGEFEIDVLEKHAFAEGKAKIADRDQWGSFFAGRVRAVVCADILAKKREKCKPAGPSGDKTAGKGAPAFDSAPRIH